MSIMSREIYTYTDLIKLGDNEAFQEIRYYPQVTDSSELRKGLVGTREKDGFEGIFAGDHKMRVTEFHRLEQAAFEGWGTEQSKFYELILLSEFLRKKKDDASGDKKKIDWLIGCKRNLGSLLSSIILLEQAEVRADNIHLHFGAPLP